MNEHTLNIYIWALFLTRITSMKVTFQGGVQFTSIHFLILFRHSYLIAIGHNRSVQPPLNFLCKTCFSIFGNKFHLKIAEHDKKIQRASSAMNFVPFCMIVVLSIKIFQKPYTRAAYVLYVVLNEKGTTISLSQKILE